MIRALRMFAAVVGMWAVAPFAAAETPLADAAEKADRVRVQALLKDGARPLVSETWRQHLTRHLFECRSGLSRAVSGRVCAR